MASAQEFPGGCYIGFNALIDRLAAQNLITSCQQMKNSGFSTINILISSGGGLIDQALYLYNLLMALPVRIITHNIGSVQSCANLPFLAGAERYGTDGCSFFFHQTSYDAPPGTKLWEGILEERLKWVRLEDERTANIYATRTGSPINAVRDWMKNELIMSETTAVKNGLIRGTRSPQVPPNALFHQVVV